MNYTLRMCVIEREQNLGHDFPYLTDGDERARLDHVLQRARIDVFHHDIRPPLMLDKVEHGDDIGMQTTTGRLRLRGETLEEALGVVDVLEDLRTQSLDGERSVDLFVVTLVYDADRPAPDHVIDAIFPHSFGNCVALHRGTSLHRERPPPDGMSPDGSP